MDESEKESLHKKAIQVIERTGRFVKDVSAPQIQAYTSQYNRYLENLAIASGVFAGATVTILSLDIEKVLWLAIIGLIPQIMQNFIEFWSVRVFPIFLLHESSLFFNRFIKK